MGEPSGIGPEVAMKAWTALGGQIGERALRLVGSRAVFHTAAAQCALCVEKLDAAIVDIGNNISVSPGKPSADTANAVTSAISECVRILKAGDAAALVTAPIHKAVLTAAGFGFPGHTEYLTALTGAERAVMMLSADELSPRLRVVPLTVHTPLKTALLALSSDAICASAEILLEALRRDFGIAVPRIAVAGINPHAGEGGTIGNEDREIIAPAISELRARGHAVSGPFPADTLFHDEARGEYDAALCMYHDQALIPIKTLAFWTSVNVTLGLPIVRTSPDHGTALDIAGRGIANEKSMIAAIHTAADIADRRGL
jgi:4-hydroxythreonine-4-phosphate dehydrogenase